MIGQANPSFAQQDTGGNPQPAPGRARILLVDDDERNLLALSEVLEPVADIVQATSGRDALRKLLNEEFAVILLDVFMPEMDGYETATLIRKRAQTSRIPIIFLSAVNKETEHLMRGYAMGAVDYVFKPVDPLILRSKVSVFVDLFLLRQQVAEQAQERAAHMRFVDDGLFPRHRGRLVVAPVEKTFRHHRFRHGGCAVAAIE